MRKKPPCWKDGQDCIDRTSECHASCEAYIEWSKEMEQLRKIRLAEYEKWNNPKRSMYNQRIRLGIKK